MLSRPSADGQLKYLKYTLNSMNEFLLLLVISFLRSRLKILRMSCYKSMKTFQDNLELVINKYLCSLHDLFPGIDSISNKQVLSGMIKYNYYHNYISTFFKGYIFLFTQMIIVISMSLIIQK